MVVEGTGGGVDTVRSSVTTTLGSEVENLQLTGAAALDATGNAAANVLTGNTGANRLDGGAGADTMTGGAGDDTYVIDDAGDRISEFAGGGRDAIEVSVSTTLGAIANIEDLVLGGTSNIDGTGDAQDNRIRGNAGNNVLQGGWGNDLLDGGAGNDTLTGDDGSFAGNDTLTGGDGNDLFTDVGFGEDVADGGAGDDTFLVSSYNTATIDGGDGTDTVELDTATTDLRSMTLTGIEVLDLSYVDYTSRILTFDQIADVQTITSSDAPYSQIRIIIDGTSRPIDFSTKVAAGYSLALAAGVAPSGGAQGVTITGSSGNDLIGSYLANDSLSGGEGNDTLAGEAGADTLTGGAGDDDFLDGMGSDRAEGGDGNDRFDITLADAGDRDTLLGGAGDDVFNSYVFGSTVSGALVLDGGDGFDRLYIGGAGLIAGTDVTLTSIEQVHMMGPWLNATIAQVAALPLLIADSQRITLTLSGAGGTLDLTSRDLAFSADASALRSGAVLTTGAHNDTLTGSAYRDTLTGGAGDDTYGIRNAGDVVVEQADGGHDSVSSSIAYVLGDNVEDLTLSGEANIGGMGNAADNTITGNFGANRLSGLDGHDTIFGDGGNDTLLGGNGDDFLDGSAGNDLALGGDGNDTLQLTDGGDTLYGGAGDDTFLVSDYWTLGYEVIEGDIAVPLFPVMRGGSGIDTLKVGYADGALALFDFSGIEILDLQAWVPTYLRTSQLRGLQSLTTSDDPGGLLTIIVTDGGSVDFARLLADGQAIMAGTSAGTAVRFASGSGADSLYGGAEGDRLSGGAGADMLAGYGGNDILIGGAGADTMLGGAGNDIYTTDDTDVVTELAGEGTDLVVATGASATLAANVENLRRAGDADFLGAGNELANILLGGAGRDTLDGGAGDDRLYGGLGSDVLTGGDGRDRFVLSTALDGELNVDQIADFVSGTDRLLLSHDVFTALDPGVVSGSELFLKPAQHAFGGSVTIPQPTADTRFIYDRATGTLSYDADGSGEIAAVAFAKLAPGTLLAAADLVVI